MGPSTPLTLTGTWARINATLGRWDGPRPWDVGTMHLHEKLRDQITCHKNKV